jgi:hypothetical protein
VVIPTTENFFGESKNEKEKKKRKMKRGKKMKTENLKKEVMKSSSA